MCACSIMHTFPMVIEKPTFYTYCTLPCSLHLTIYIYTHLQKFGIQEQSDSTELCIHRCTPASTDSASHKTNTMEVTLHSSSSAQKQSVFWNKPTELPTFMVARGGARRCDSGEGVRRLVGVSGEDGYVSTAQHEDLLARMMQSHTTGDFCLVGGKVHVCMYSHTCTFKLLILCFGVCLHVLHFLCCRAPEKQLL